MAGIDEARWSELSPKLDELLELAGEARARRLAELATADASLGEELADLLARQEAVERSAFLEGPALPEAASATLVGRRVGGYTIERELGQGGMGAVWLARRSDGRFEGRAAVKFLHLALLGRTGVERFQREGSILARLSHQNIARLIDAGVAEGQPYLVLEYVEGQPIDRWCDVQALGVEARIRLWLGVLAAVAHAHDRLVLHRDLKPSNVLVTGDGQPKLLDFGIAKLLDGGAAGQATGLTGQMGRPYTPGYAAPEQVQGGDVTTATDVYSLGVTLFRLLAGVHPTDAVATRPTGPGRAAAPPAIARASQAAARVPPELARRRAGATPAELARELRGDLDNILARAMEPDPGRRYPTAHALEDDLRRYLAREPVAARAGTFAYRLGKAVQRHRAAFAVAAAVALVLVAAVASTTWEAAEAGRQRAQAIRERERADREAERAKAQRDFAFRQLFRAEAVADLDEFLLYEAAPNGKPFTADDLLARAERIVSRQRPASDPNRLEMLVAIGNHYYYAENLARARKLLEEAWSLSRTIDEPSTRAKAACALAQTLGRSGEGARAEEMFQEALAALPDEPQFAMALVACLRAGAQVARDGGDAAVGIDRTRAAAELLGRLDLAQGFLATSVTLDLADSYRAVGRLREAAVEFQRASEQLALLGRDDTETAGTIFNNWAVALGQLGRPLEEEALYRRALRINSAGREEGVSPLLLKSLGQSLVVLHRLREAAELAERAYAEAQRVHEELAINHALLLRADVYRELGDLPRSERALDEVEPRLRRMLPPGHYGFSTVESLRSLLELARGDLAAARAAADRALAIAEATSQGAWLLSTLLSRRAEIELQDRRWEVARRYAERAVEQGRAISGDATPARQLGVASLALGRALQGQGHLAAAREAFALASAQLRVTLGPDHPMSRQADRLASESEAAR